MFSNKTYSEESIRMARQQGIDWTRFMIPGSSTPLNIKDLDLLDPTTFMNIDNDALVDNLIQYQKTTAMNKGIQQRASDVLTRQTNLNNAIQRSGNYTTDSSIHNAAAAVEEQELLEEDELDFFNDSMDDLTAISQAPERERIRGGGATSSIIGAVLPPPTYDNDNTQNPEDQQSLSKTISGIDDDSEEELDELPGYGGTSDDGMGEQTIQNEPAVKDLARLPVPPKSTGAIPKRPTKPVANATSRSSDIEPENLQIISGIVASQRQPTQPPVTVTPESSKQGSSDPDDRKHMALLTIFNGMTETLLMFNDPSYNGLITPAIGNIIDNQVEETCKLIQSLEEEVKGKEDQTMANLAINTCCLMYRNIVGSMMNSARSSYRGQAKLDLILSKIEVIKQTAEENQQLVLQKINTFEKCLEIKTEGLQNLVTKLEEQITDVTTFQHIVVDNLQNRNLVGIGEQPKMDIHISGTASSAVPSDRPGPSRPITIRHKVSDQNPHKLVMDYELILTNSRANTVETISQALAIKPDILRKAVDKLKGHITNKMWNEGQLTILCLPFYKNIRDQYLDLFEKYKDIYLEKTGQRYLALAEVVNKVPTIQSNVAIQQIPQAQPIRKTTSQRSLHTYHAKPYAFK